MTTWSQWLSSLDELEQQQGDALLLPSPIGGEGAHIIRSTSTSEGKHWGHNTASNQSRGKPRIREIYRQEKTTVQSHSNKNSTIVNEHPSASIKAGWNPQSSSLEHPPVQSYPTCNTPSFLLSRLLLSLPLLLPLPLAAKVTSATLDLSSAAIAHRPPTAPLFPAFSLSWESSSRMSPA